MTVQMDPASLRSLVRLVDQSGETIIAEYKKEDAMVPSLSALEPGPLDTPERYSVALSDAVKTLEGACGQLAISCTSPGYTMVHKALTLYEPASLNLVLNARVADHLGDDEAGMPIAELAKKTGIDEGKLGRIMRFLASTHVFIEVGQNVFANNRLSVKLRDTDPTSALLGHLTDEIFTAAARFSETIGDPKATSGLSPDYAPFHRAFGMTIFEHYGSVEGRFRAERFNRAMLGWGRITGASGLLSQVYPWREQPSGTVICDVGGGNGYVMLGLLKTHDHLRAIVQDRPLALEDAQKLWGTEYPLAIETQRITFRSVDFFKETPVKDCAFYYMRHILHDWNDSDSIQILKGIRAVMNPCSKLLIQEVALPHLVRFNSGTTTYAPEPLLPNYGLGGGLSYYADVHMMNNANAKERTLSEFEYLGCQAGLKLTKVIDCGKMSLLEMSPA